MDHSEAGRLGYEKAKSHLHRWCDKVRKKAKARWAEKTCSECGRVIAYEKRRNKYCSHSCAAKATNRGVCRHGEPRLSDTCERCGASLNKGKRFCSRECSGAAKADAQFSRLDSLATFDGECEGAVRLAGRRPYSARPAGYRHRAGRGKTRGPSRNPSRLYAKVAGYLEADSLSSVFKNNIHLQMN